MWLVKQSSGRSRHARLHCSFWHLQRKRLRRPRTMFVFSMALRKLIITQIIIIYLYSQSAIGMMRWIVNSCLWTVVKKESTNIMKLSQRTMWVHRKVLLKQKRRICGWLIYSFAKYILTIIYFSVRLLRLVKHLQMLNFAS